MIDQRDGQRADTRIIRSARRVDIRCGTYAVWEQNTTYVKNRLLTGFDDILQERAGMRHSGTVIFALPQTTILLRLMPKADEGKPSRRPKSSGQKFLPDDKIDIVQKA
jgi:hypothetical protein